jgi:hypothetical protein
MFPTCPILIVINKTLFVKESGSLFLMLKKNPVDVIMKIDPLLIDSRLITG